MARIIDLDDVIPDDITVKTGGVDYKLPADIPVPDYLAIVRAAQTWDDASGEDQLSATDDLYQRVLELFQYRQPSLDKLPVGLAQLVRLVVSLYGVDSDEDEAADPTPAAPSTPKRRNGTKPRATRATSGSSTSRARSRTS